jgi:hypothetical protein
VLTSAFWDLLFQPPRLPINPMTPPTLPLDLFDQMIVLAVLCYLFARRHLVDEMPLTRRDRIVAAAVGSLRLVIFVGLIALAVDLGHPEFIARLHGGFLTPSYLITWLDTPLLAFLMLLALTLSLRIPPPTRALVRHALWAAAKMVAAGVLVGELLRVGYWLFEPNAKVALQDRFTAEGLVYPLLYGIYLNLSIWLRWALHLTVELAAFLYGLRIAFPTVFPTPAAPPVNRPRVLRYLALGGVLFVVLLIFTSQVQPWRVGPLHLWCAVKWPGQTANAIWRGYDGMPLSERPAWDASHMAELRIGECIQVVGRDATKKWFAIQRDEAIGWAELEEMDVEWLANPARLPIVTP